MKKLMLLLAWMTLLSGCAWFHRGEQGGDSTANGYSGPDAGPVRGTTGVSSGADAGAGITGSDLAPR